MVLPHAIVRFVNNKTDHGISIIEISHIKEFKHTTPDDCFDFIRNHIYYGKENGTSPYVPISIFALGSESELQEKIENEPALMRKFKAHKFNTSDYEKFLNSSLDNSLSPIKNKEKEDNHDNSDTSTNSTSDNSKEGCIDESPSLIAKTRKRLTTKSKNFKQNQYDSCDESHSEKMNKEKEILYINKEQQQATLKYKMDMLENVNNLEMPGTSETTNPDIEKHEELFERLKKLEKENKCLKQILQKQNITQKQSNLTKAKKRLSYELEFGDVEDENSVDSEPFLRNQFPMKIHVDESLSNLPKTHDNVYNKIKIFEKWTQTVNGQEVEMIYLGQGISIQFLKWKECKKAKTTSLFVKNLAHALWGVSKLANRVLKESSNIQKFSNRESPRKVLSPQKIYVLEECVRFFLSKIKPNLVKRDIETEIGKIRSYLSEEIAYQLRQYKLNIKKQMEQEDY